MGSALKAEVKAGTAHEIGVQVEDLLEAAQRDCERSVGAITALNEVAKYIGSLHGVVDKEIEAGTCDLPTGQKAKLYVTRAMAAAETLAKKYSNLQQVSDGRAQGLKAAISTIKKAHDEAKAQALAPVEASNGEARVSIKQKRLLEDAQAQQETSKGPAPKAAQPRRRRATGKG